MFTMSERMAVDAKVEDGDKGWLRRALKQLRKDSEEERAAREHQKEMKPWMRHRSLRRNRSSVCARSSRNTCTCGTEKVEDQAASAPKSGK